MRQNFKELRQVGLNDYKDKNFCTVAALACTLDWSFGKAHRWMARHAGRTNGRGVYLRDWLPAIKMAARAEGKRFETYDGIRCQTYTGLPTTMTLNRFCKEHPRGIYYVQVNGHVLAIVDGAMLDWTAETAGRRKIQNCYQLVTDEAA